MLVQLTDYGVSILTETKKPLNITKYVLGSAVGYTPAKDATGIRGEQVYTNSPTEPVACSANVVKYVCTLSYEVGNFSFGEAAFFDEESKCVAIGVADALIDKQKYKDEKFGNSIILDLYLSMVDGNYDMWIDEMRSDNEFNLPICGSPDALLPVKDAPSNFYIITNAGRGQSSTLAYASLTGLWDFDCYQYHNSHQFEITGCTEGAVTIDGNKLTSEDISMLQPDYVGQLILEFTDGPNQSICRSIASFRVINGVGTFSLYTPMVTAGEIGNHIRIYSRQIFSISDTVLPVASEDSLGAVQIGDGLSITPEGVVSVDFPVTSVNGQVGDVIIDANDLGGLSDVATSGDYNDLLNVPSPYILPVATEDTLGGVRVSTESNIEIDYSGFIDLAFLPVKSVNNAQPDPDTGNVTIKFDDAISGLIFPKRIYSQADLNEFSASGLYYILAEDANTIVNAPEDEFSNDLALQVLPISDGFENGPAVQILFSTGIVYVRQNTGSSWTPWSQFITTEGIPYASKTERGIAQIGDGISVDNGIISADITSVFGKTGDVELTGEEWKAQLQSILNQYDGIPQLTDNEVANDDPDALNFGRISHRQLTYGGLYFAGDWDADQNTVNSNPEQQLVANGQITYNIGTDEDPAYDTWTPQGWIVRVSVGKNELNFDGMNRVRSGDLLISLNGMWRKFYENRSFTPWPKANGFFYVYNNYTYGRNITSTDNSIRYPTLSADETTGQINDFDITINMVDGGTF